MHNSGAGGVEINPIALNDLIKNVDGEALEWLSDEWYAQLRLGFSGG